MGNNPQSSGTRCPRCRTELGEGVYYCVACGCTLEGASAARRIGVEQELMKRRDNAQNQQFAMRMFRWFRWGI